MVDALDEAAEAAAIAKQLLGPLTGMSKVRLVIGTTSRLLPMIRTSEVIDIDQPQHAEKGDIVGYVSARLLRRDEPGAATPYR